MKRFFLILVFSLVICACNKEIISNLHEVDDVCTMMDDITFMDYCYKEFDVNNDGIVSMTEAKAVKQIVVDNKGIYSLKGIEYFTQLTILYCIENKLTSLDVSNNTQLTKLSCYSNYLTSLDFSKNTNLRVLNCSMNKLTSLDISKNTQLTELRCDSNYLTSLDVSNNTQLTKLWCIRNNLTSLDVSALPVLNRNDFASWGYQNNDIFLTITDKKEYWLILPTENHLRDCRIRWIWK